MNSNDLLQAIMPAADKAAKFLITQSGKTHNSSIKTDHHDILTESDIKSQNIIQKNILNTLMKKGIQSREIGFIGEESMYSTSKYTFVIDPIDGTANFASGNTFFSISIAVFVNGTMQAGIVCHPNTSSTYLAVKEKGAYLHRYGKKRRLKIIPFTLDKALISIYLRSLESKENMEKSHVLELYHIARAIRYNGSSALETAQLANNELQACVYGDVRIWDIAASQLIVEEGGGKFIQWDGKDNVFDLKSSQKLYPIIAGHAQVCEKLLNIINSPYVTRS